MTYPNHLGLVRALFILSVWITSFGCAEFADGAWTDPETSHFQLKSSADFPAPNASCAERQRISPQGPALVFIMSTRCVPFNLPRILQRIINTSGGESTVEALAQQFLNTHGARHRRRIEDAVAVDRRPPGSTYRFLISEICNEAVFNRIDLAALDGAHCGERGVVYV